MPGGQRPESLDGGLFRRKLSLSWPSTSGAGGAATWPLGAGNQEPSVREQTAASPWFDWIRPWELGRECMCFVWQSFASLEVVALSKGVAGRYRPCPPPPSLGPRVAVSWWKRTGQCRLFGPAEVILSASQSRRHWWK